VLLTTAIEYKTNWYNELEYRKINGIKAPDSCPHPDDIHIDPENESVTWMKPLTPQQNKYFHWILERWRKYKADLLKLQAELKSVDNATDKKSINSDISVILQRQKMYSDQEPWLLNDIIIL
jgi:hypothetical protein